MFLYVIIGSFLAGVLSVLYLEWHLFQKFVFQKDEKKKVSLKPEVKRCVLPEELKYLIQSENYKDEAESWLSVNLILQFLFKEWKDTSMIRKFFFKKITLEFEEFLQNTTAGKFLENITVKDLSLGDKCPILKDIKVTNVILHPVHDHIKEIDIEMKVDYTGGCELFVEADTVLGKSADLAVKMSKLSGTGRIQFSQDPYSHWSFAFLEPPETKFEVKSQLLPQITSLIISQIRRVLKKRHTLPQYKIRYKPFCVAPDLRYPSTVKSEVNVYGAKLSNGYLCVNVVECNRLIDTPKNSMLYCTLAIDSSAWVELVSSRTSSWTMQDVKISKAPNQAAGILLKQEFIFDKCDYFVVVETIVPNSPASAVDIKKNDILVSICGIRVTTVNHAVKLFKQAGDKYLIRIERRSNLRCSSSQEFLSKDLKLDEDTLSMKDDENSQIEDDDDYVSYSVKDASDMQKRSSLHKKLMNRKLEESSPKLQRKKYDESELGKRSENSYKHSNNQPQTHCDNLHTLNATETESIGSGCTDSDKSLDSSYGGHDIDLKKTTISMASSDPVWEEKFEFLLSEKHRFLNIGVWNKSKDRKPERNKPDKDILIGYASISLSDVALECALMQSGSCQKTYALSPPEPKAVASRDHKLQQHSGFDPKLCHGDITLLFVHKPDNHDVEGIESDDDNDVGSKEAEVDDFQFVVDTNGSKKSHDFIGAHFHSSTICNFCRKKIWLKTAFQCRNCAMVCHKKCADKCRSSTICESSIVDGKLPNDLVKVTLSTDDTPNMVTDSEDLLSESMDMRTASDTKNLNVNDSLQCSLQENPFSLIQKDDDMDAVIERLLQHHPQDEMLVSTAKDLGKELYATLPLNQRKIKLNIMIAKLQSEITDEDKRRQELQAEEKETDNLATKTKLTFMISQSDKKAQALAVLMLHYFAGLQHCLDMEKIKIDDKRTNNAVDEVDNTLEPSNEPELISESENNDSYESPSYECHTKRFN